MCAAEFNSIGILMAVMCVFRNMCFGANARHNRDQHIYSTNVPCGVQIIFVTLAVVRRFVINYCCVWKFFKTKISLCETIRINYIVGGTHRKCFYRAESSICRTSIYFWDTVQCLNLRILYVICRFFILWFWISFEYAIKFSRFYHRELYPITLI